MGFNWSSYDYRAITAGGVMTLLASFMLWSVPQTTLTCDSTTNRCEIVTSDRSLRKTRASVELSRVQSARDVCRRSSEAAVCSYVVELVLHDGRKPVFSDVDDPAVAKQLSTAVRSYLEHKNGPLLLTHSPSKAFELGVLALSVLLLALGIRKNLVDKGVIGSDRVPL